jgi:hypothetical protein
VTQPSGTDDADGIAAAAAPLLARAGVAPPVRLLPIAGGGNNRVYRVESAGEPVVLKVYFRHPDDPRDRLRADFGFSAFAWEVGVRALPQPIAGDPATGMAVYEYIPGRKLAPGEVTAAHVAEAAAFFRAVNERRADPRAADLPPASEACFSIAGHLDCVERRVDRLATIDGESPRGHDAAALVAGRLRPAWVRARSAVIASACGTADEPLVATDRCVSPSDFGFHNALSAADGRLRFLDFEYAGWDDPAKTVCDFFCQPAVPAPREHLATFIDALSPLWRDPAAFVSRAATLLPVYELKWCCIMLNEFLPSADSRRTFAGATADREARRAAQLAKVAAALDRIGA